MTRLPETQSGPPGHRFEELDSLRGIAALTVIVGHFLNVWKTQAWWGTFNASPLRVVAAGHEAVVLFFLLSGFVLAIPFSKGTGQTYREFIVRRVCRIYVPYALAVGLAALADSRLYSLTPTGNAWIDQTWNQPPARDLIIQHLLMIGHYDTAQLNTAFWSLVYEMRISLIYPLLYLFSRRVQTPLLLIGTFLATVVAALCADRWGSQGFFYDFLYGGFFIVGIILQQYILPMSRWFRRLANGRRAAVIALALICFDAPGALPAHRLFGSALLPLYLDDWITLVGAVFILVSAITLHPFRKFLHLPFVLRLGRISYSAYLIHGTVLFVLIRLYFGRPYFGWLFPCYLLVTYLLSELFHLLVEQPSTTLGRKAGAKMRARQVAAIAEAAGR